MKPPLLLHIRMRIYFLHGAIFPSSAVEVNRGARYEKHESECTVRECVSVSLKGHCELFIFKSIGTEHNYCLQVKVSLGLRSYFLIMNPACALHRLPWTTGASSDTQNIQGGPSAATSREGWSRSV